MAKIESKSSLMLGTNYKYHLVDFQGNDIAIDVSNSRITSTTTDFTVGTESGGIVKRPIAVGDLITVQNASNAANEGVGLTVTAVSANQIDFSVFSGGPVDESAGADINITAFKKTYEFLEAGGLLFADGVSAITWASKVVDDWDVGNLDVYPKMYTSIEPRAKALACLNGWEPHNNYTLKSHRDMAMEIRDTATSPARRVYFCARSGDTDEPTDQFTVWPATDAAMDAPRLAVTTGYMNELFLLQDIDNSIDNRGNWTFRCLEPGKTHIQQTIDVQFAEIISVSSENAIDPKLADGAGDLLVSDPTVAAGGIYADILVNEDSDSLYDGDVDGANYTYTGFVDADNQTNEDVHAKIHYLLRQPGNINSDGSGPQIRGDKAPPISSFLGELFFLDRYYLLNYTLLQRNNLRLVDTSGVARSWPSRFTLTQTAPVIAQGGNFSIMHADTFGSSSPTYLQDESGSEQDDITIGAQVNITIAYSTYNVDGHTPGTPIPLVMSYNRPGFIEPDHIFFTMSNSNQTVTIQPVADPSYSAA